MILKSWHKQLRRVGSVSRSKLLNCWPLSDVCAMLRIVMIRPDIGHCRISSVRRLSAATSCKQGRQGATLLSKQFMEGVREEYGQSAPPIFSRCIDVIHVRGLVAYVRASICGLMCLLHFPTYLLVDKNLWTSVPFACFRNVCLLTSICVDLCAFCVFQNIRLFPSICKWVCLSHVHVKRALRQTVEDFVSTAFMDWHASLIYTGKGPWDSQMTIWAWVFWSWPRPSEMCLKRASGKTE